MIDTHISRIHSFVQDVIKQSAISHVKQYSDSTTLSGVSGHTETILCCETKCDKIFDNFEKFLDQDHQNHKILDKDESKQAKISTRRWYETRLRKKKHFPPYTCNVCLKKFTYKRNFNRHFDTDHSCFINCIKYDKSLKNLQNFIAQNKPTNEINNITLKLLTILRNQKCCKDCWESLSLKLPAAG